MNKMSHVVGLDKLIARLKAQEQQLLTKLNVGIGQAALYLQNESQKIVPVDEGNLHASAFTRKSNDWNKTQPSYDVGYTAEYAIYVHEIPDPPVAHGKSFNIKHAKEIQAGTEHRRGSNQQYKFLEKPAREKRKQMVAIVKRALK